MVSQFPVEEPLCSLIVLRFLPPDSRGNPKHSMTQTYQNQIQVSEIRSRSTWDRMLWERVGPNLHCCQFECFPPRKLGFVFSFYIFTWLNRVSHCSGFLDEILHNCHFDHKTHWFFILTWFIWTKLAPYWPVDLCWITDSQFLLNNKQLNTSDQNHKMTVWTLVLLMLPHKLQVFVLFCEADRVRQLTQFKPIWWRPGNHRWPGWVQWVGFPFSCLSSSI